MLPSSLNVSFLICWAIYAFAIYGPKVRRFRGQRIAQEHSRPQDVLHDMATLVAWQLLPLVHIFTPWLDFANYHLPGWAGWVGVATLASALVVLSSAYRALGANWSPKLDIREGQRLITNGIYSLVRHPIYAGMWLWTVSQPLVVQNWIAGWAMLVLFMPLYLSRVRREEAMLLECFAEEYQIYMRNTGRVFPLLFRRTH
jgi:protein-S-isoprenylcysteine O-methyltransferase Ste14